MRYSGQQPKRTGMCEVAEKGSSALPCFVGPRAEAERWQKQAVFLHTYTLPVVTAGGVEGGNRPSLCIKIMRGHNTTRTACEAPGTSRKPRGGSLEKRALGELRPGEGDGRLGTWLGEHTGGQRQPRQACCLQLSAHAQHNRLQGAAFALARQVPE